jgi:hypothetical protein
MIGAHVTDLPALQAAIYADDALGEDGQGLRSTLYARGAKWWTSLDGQQSWAWLDDVSRLMEMAEQLEIPVSFYAPEQVFPHYGIAGEDSVQIVRHPFVYDDQGNATLKAGVSVIPADETASAAFQACYNASPVEIKDDNGQGTGQYSTPDPIGRVIAGFDRSHLVL